ncbi:MAG: hypothetical protein ACOCX2_01445 [Armatimonadota bacterium]
MKGKLGPVAGRKGAALATAVAFAATALLLIWLALNSLLGPYAGTPRRQVLAVLSIVLATGGLGVSVAVVVGAVRRRRKLEAQMRPGEQIVGMFPAEIIDLGDDDAAVRARSVGLTLTNQRLLIHEPERDPAPKLSFEHEEIAQFKDLGPTPSRGLRRSVLYEMVLRDQTRLCIRMDAATGMDLKGPRSQYLDERRRELRALIIEATGPTPSRSSQTLDRILVDGRPTVCLFELDENYLRIVGEHSPPLADLYYYFHWEHMDVGELKPAEIEGLPQDWRTLRLRFHGASSLVVCGTEQAVQRIRERAISGGAATSEEAPSPISGH